MRSGQIRAREGERAGEQRSTVRAPSSPPGGRTRARAQLARIYARYGTEDDVAPKLRKGVSNGEQEAPSQGNLIGLTANMKYICPTPAYYCRILSATYFCFVDLSNEFCGRNENIVPPHSPCGHPAARPSKPERSTSTSSIALGGRRAGRIARCQGQTDRQTDIQSSQHHY